MSSQTKCNGKKEWTKKFIMVVKLDGCYVWHSQCCRVSLLTLFSLLSVSLDSDKKSKRRFFFFFLSIDTSYLSTLPISSNRFSSFLFLCVLLVLILSTSNDNNKKLLCPFNNLFDAIDEDLYTIDVH